MLPKKLDLELFLFRCQLGPLINLGLDSFKKLMIDLIARETEKNNRNRRNDQEKTKWGLGTFAQIPSAWTGYPVPFSYRLNTRETSRIPRTQSLSGLNFPSMIDCAARETTEDQPILQV